MKQLTRTTFYNLTELLGRLLLTAIFLISGINKIMHYAETQGFMESAGVPGILLPLVILTEVLGSALVIIGYQTRIATLALAGFSILSAIIFHHDFNNQMQTIMFLKDISMAGAFLIIFGRGPGQVSVDMRRFSQIG